MLFLMVDIADPRSPTRKQIRILVVDDNQSIGETLTEIFRHHDYDADFAVSGDDAVDRLESAPYHVVVLDIMMPGLSGVEVLKRIRRIDPRIKVILMTGHASSDLIEEAKQLDPDKLLYKPILPDQLLAHVRRLAR